LAAEPLRVTFEVKVGFANGAYDASVFVVATGKPPTVDVRKLEEVPLSGPVIVEPVSNTYPAIALFKSAKCGMSGQENVAQETNPVNVAASAVIFPWVSDKPPESIKPLVKV
jgi:hypothetical protein